VTVVETFSLSISTFGGRGEVKTARTVCYEIMRDFLRALRQFNAREFRVLASVPVIDIFLDERIARARDAHSFSSSPLPSSTSPCRTSVLPAARLLGMNELEKESGPIGKTISLKPEASHSRERYDIVLIRSAGGPKSRRRGPSATRSCATSRARPRERARSPTPDIKALRRFGRSANPSGD
jgi:hypothetical protein